MTGESKIVRISTYLVFLIYKKLCFFFYFFFPFQVHKDSKDPFLMSGCKIADGSGIMLVKKDTFSSFLFFSLFLFLLVMLRIGKCKRNRGESYLWIYSKYICAL
jgi:hypothetical protein